MPSIKFNMPSIKFLLKVVKYNLKKTLPIKLILSQCHLQNGTKFPHMEAFYRVLRDIELKFVYVYLETPFAGKLVSVSHT